MKEIERLADGTLVVAMEPGEKLRILGRKGWVIDLIGTDSGADLEHKNPTDDGMGEKFRTYSSVGTPYGNGLVVQERTLGVPCIKAGFKVDGNIVGALVMDASGKIMERFSFSNVVFFQNRPLAITENGELMIGGALKGYLSAVFLADKNVIVGYVGVFTPTKPTTVKMLEMETLLIASVL